MEDHEPVPGPGFSPAPCLEWRFGLAVTALVISTKLLYMYSTSSPATIVMGDRSHVGLGMKAAVDESF